MPTAIPIRNIYFLLCYAFNQLRETDAVDVATVGVTDVVDLLARVMISGVNRLRRRGFERGYIENEQELRGIRGRINITATVRHFQYQHGRATCIFDELTIDTPQNRVMKAAMRTLAAVDGLDRSNRVTLKRLCQELSDVPERPLTRGLLRSVRLHANNKHYRFLMDVSALILACAVPDERTGSYRFRNFSREGPEMARLFESFVRNFLRKERPDLLVEAEHVDWVATSDDDADLRLLPRMRTDITVRSGRRTLVIETKFYEETLQTYYDKASVHSQHLYQLLAYIGNMAQSQEGGVRVEGMLLYPVTADSLDLSYEILGRAIRIRTIDLSQPWMDIVNQMHSLAATMDQ